MALPSYITPELVMIFLTFVLVVYILYKLFRVMFKAAVIAVASFSFPWVVKILDLPLPIEADVQTGLYFVIAGLGLFSIYQFFHFATYLLKILTWPLRLFLKKKTDIKKLKKDVEKIKKSH